MTTTSMTEPADRTGDGEPADRRHLFTTTHGNPGGSVRVKFWWAEQGHRLHALRVLLDGNRYADYEVGGPPICKGLTPATIFALLPPVLIPGEVTEILGIPIVYGR